MRSIQSRIFPSITRCKMCGNLFILQGFIEKSRMTRLMEKHHICCECAYWKNLIDYPPKGLEVVYDVALKIMPFVEKKDRTAILGGKGKTKYYMRMDGTVFKSNDVWTLGKIPLRFRDSLPITAWEIDSKTYKKICNMPLSCHSKECLDRYRCLRYRCIEERGKKPYNNVPLKWKAGGEHCIYFIDHAKINGYFITIK